MANPTTNFGWVMPTSSSLVTNLPADFNTFGQAVDTSMSELLGGTTGQVLSKTSNTNMDFTWITPTDQTPLTTKGDLFTFTTVDARLGVGTDGQTLVADSTASTGLKWATPSSGSTFAGVSVYNSANQSIANNTATACTFDSEYFDTDGFHSTSSNTTRLTVPTGKAGYYLITANGNFSLNATGSRGLAFFKNGSYLRYSNDVIGNATYYVGPSLTVVYNLAVADYIELFVTQTSGGNLNFDKTLGGGSFTFSMELLGA